MPLQLPDKMHTLVSEAVPAIPESALAKALLVLFAIVNKIVLARNVEDPVGLHSFQDFIGGIELVGFGELGDVTGVEHQSRRLRQ